MNNNHASWLNYLTSEHRSREEDNAIIKALQDADTTKACFDIAKVIHTGTFLVKSANQQLPSIIHTFASADGDHLEMGYGQVKYFVLSGTGNSACPLSFDPNSLFHKRDMAHYSYQAIFESESTAQIQAIQPTPRQQGEDVTI